MKTKLFKSGLTLLLLAVFITGSTLLLNGGITKVQAEEDGKVITTSAAPSPSISIAAVLSSAESSESSSAPAATEQTIPTFTINNNESNYVGSPGDKDLTMNDAAMVCAKALQHLKNPDLTNGTMKMNFKKNGNGIVKRDMWKSIFTTADGLDDYSFYIDSVTGQLYSFGQSPSQSSVNSQDRADVIPSVPLSEEARKNPLMDERFTNAACNFIHAKMSDKAITSAVNIYRSGIISHDRIWVIVAVAVGLSDGTSYLVEVSDSTLDVWGFNYYPDGGAFTVHTAH